MPAGYSGTPLAKKLGIKSGLRVFADGAPASYAELLAPIPDDVDFLDRIDDETDLVHIFVMNLKELTTKLKRYTKTMHPLGVIWVSWPKKAAKFPTDVTEDCIRELAIELGWVDVKVCAVDEFWSALKLVVPLKNR